MNAEEIEEGRRLLKIAREEEGWFMPRARAQSWLLDNADALLDAAAELHLERILSEERKERCEGYQVLLKGTKNDRDGWRILYKKTAAERDEAQDAANYNCNLKHEVMEERDKLATEVERLQSIEDCHDKLLGHLPGCRCNT